MAIQILLIDADGVIQHMKVNWVDAFRRLLHGQDAKSAGHFTADIFAAEASALAHDRGFLRELDSVLLKWNIAERRDEVIAAMCDLEVYQDNIEVIQGVRRAGIRCYLATNQETGRARFMSDRFGYPALFDGAFYSCYVRAVKPYAQFFESAITALGVDAASVLFIDDRLENVEGARKVGLNAEVYNGADGADTFRALLADYGVVL